MPATAYTVEIWRLENATGPYPIGGFSPPAGFIWVIRDVAFWFPGTSGFWPLEGQALLQVSGLTIAGTPAFRSFRNVVYRVRDIRQVIGAADLLFFTAGSDGWNVSVTGYQLTST